MGKKKEKKTCTYSDGEQGGQGNTPYLMVTPKK